VAVKREKLLEISHFSSLNTVAWLHDVRSWKGFYIPNAGHLILGKFYCLCRISRQERFFLEVSWIW